MYIFCIIALIICIYGGKIRTSSEEFLAINSSTALKGIFIMLVFFSHFNGYVVFEFSADYAYLKVINWIGQSMVGIFLFISGYGIMESIKNKPGYIMKIPQKRILATLFRFDIAVCIFVIANLVMGIHMDAMQVILSLFAWTKVGNSNWYIFDILVLYSLTFFPFYMYKRKVLTMNQALIGVGILNAMFIVAIRILKGSYWWYDTVPCYFLGLLWSYKKELINDWITKWWGASISVAIIGTIVSKYMIMYGNLFRIISNLFFVVCILLISERVVLYNRVLKHLGDYLFEIYILMRLPMMILENTVLKQNVYLFFVVCVIITLVVSVIFKTMVGKAWDILLSKYDRRRFVCQ